MDVQFQRTIERCLASGVKFCVTPCSNRSNSSGGALMTFRLRPDSAWASEMSSSDSRKPLASGNHLAVSVFGWIVDQSVDTLDEEIRNGTL